MKVKHRLLNKLWLAILLFSAPWTLSAQTIYRLAPSPELKVEGGSSLHDWNMVSNVAKGEGRFILEGNRFKGINSLQVTMEAESLKSGTKGLDNNAYKALDTKKHPEVKFTLRELTGEGTTYQAKGEFTIAGVTKPASFPVKVTQSGEKITFEGSHSTTLSTFSIDPPTALMGTVKTRDAITISFKAIFQPNQ